MTSPPGTRTRGRAAPPDLVDSIGSRLEKELETDPFQRDAAFLERHISKYKPWGRYFSPEVHGLENLPEEGPYLLVGNHSGGLYTPDAYALVVAVSRHQGYERPFYFLAFDLLFAVPGLNKIMRKAGAIPASPEHPERQYRSHE